MSIFRFWILGCVALAACQAQGIIRTHAGTDWVFTANGRPALEAPIGGARGLAIDRDGNLFVADQLNNMVFKVSPDGILTVVAGNGFRAFSGDGGPATAAALNSPYDVAVASDGSLFIADAANHRIRKVSPEGIMSTVAGTGTPVTSGDGGPAVRAGLLNAQSVALDSQGNVYIGEISYGVRRVDLNGVITTIAGTGQTGDTGDGGPATAATFNRVSNVRIDAQDNVYILDGGRSCRVRKVTPDGIIATVIGTGICGFSGDSGPAVSASIAEPVGVAFDRGGAIYVAEGIRVRKITPDGIVSTIAGGGPGTGDGGPARSAALGSVTGLALDAAGNVFVAGPLTRINRVTTAGTIFRHAGNGGFRVVPEGSPAAEAFLYRPLGISLDAGGNVHIADQLNSRTRRIGLDGQFNTTAGSGQTFCQSGTPAALSAAINFPADVAVDASGAPHLSSIECNRVARVDPDGILRFVAGSTGGPGFGGDGGPGPSALLRGPQELTFDPAGNLYIADTNNHRIRRLAPDGIISTVAGNGTAGFVGDGQPALSASLNAPQGVAFQGGFLYIADTRNHRIRRVAPDGTISTIAGAGLAGFSGDGGPAIRATLRSPRGIALDAAGNLYIADQNNHRVRWVTPAGNITTIAGDGRANFSGDGGPAASASLNLPVDVAVDADGSIYISDSNNDRIRVVTNTAPFFQVAPGTLSFSARSSGAAPPEQSLQLAASAAGLPFSVTVENAPWLRVTPDNGLMPATLQVSADPSRQPAGSYFGTITVNAPGAAPAMRQISVSFRVDAALPPQLGAEPAGLSFSFVERRAAESQQINVLNLGGGSLDFTATAAASAGGRWLRVTPGAGSATASAKASLTVTADSTALGAGVYTGNILIASPSSPRPITIPVTMTISGSVRTILLSQTGLSFTAVAGGGVVPPQTFAVLNAGDGVMHWTASSTVLSGGAGWLQASPASGSSNASSLTVPFVEVGINPAGLAPGEYYGQVQVSAQGADNTPQVVSVVLNVLPPGSDPGPLVRPTGLVFTGVAGGTSPGSQTVVVSNLSSRATSFVSGRLTSDNLNWFGTAPAAAATSPQQPSRIVVQPDLEGLTPGIRRGTLTLQFEDGTPRTVGLLLVLIPNAATAPRAAEGCTPTRLLPVFTLLPPNFAVPASAPNPVEVRVVDDCTDALTTGSVVLTFSNGDAPLQLVSLKDGRWSGTWQPRNTTTSQITVVATAQTADGRLRAAAQVTGGLRASQDAPVVGSGAVVSSASYAAQAPLAPGSLISIFGSRLSDAALTSSQLPLESSLAGTAVVIGGRALPLLSTSQGQINAVIPYDLTTNTRHQVVVRRGISSSVPEPVAIAAAQPGVFTKDQTGRGQGTIVDTSNRLVEPGNAARAGDAVVIYCSGLGAVDPPVTAGTRAPASPLSQVVNPVSLTIGGLEAQVLFAGLTPGSAGLYQVNAIVPAGIAATDEAPVVLRVAGQESPPVTMAVR
ncbi:MAG: hypothetical protein FJW20_14870 [Acidimicrobiia bacterium]|nr:hypothetical protein [Acidimicrobiia bacterium]